MSAVVWVVCGPAGSGKTTVGEAAAVLAGAAFVDADDLHPPANVAKMRAGQPLDEADRAGWLATATELVRNRLAAGEPTVLAISALRREHRARLGLDQPGVRAVWLAVAPDELADRLEDRTGHYFPATLLPTQLAAMEVPGPDETVEVLDGSRGVGELAEIILAG